VSSSSICIRDHNASISALSLQSPMGPIDGTSADVRALGKRPGSELRPVVAMDHGFAASCLALLDHHLERVCREGGGRVLLIDQPTTRRLNASSTTAQSTLPSRVGWSVMRRFTPEASRRRG
jgi:hypothetical protein